MKKTAIFLLLVISGIIADEAAIGMVNFREV